MATLLRGHHEHLQGYKAMACLFVILMNIMSLVSIKKKMLMDLWTATVLTPRQHMDDL